jgi:hypothetical protein
MKTSIYTFLHKKWQEENDQGMYMVFMDGRRKAVNDAMVDVHSCDAMYDQEILERVFSEIMHMN